MSEVGRHSEQAPIRERREFQPVITRSGVAKVLLINSLIKGFIIVRGSIHIRDRLYGANLCVQEHFHDEVDIYRF